MTPFIQQLYSPSLDIMMLIIAIVIDITLALVVLFSNPKNATNRIFFLLTLATVAWLTITHIVRIPYLLYDSLTLHRLGIFFAVPMSMLFFLLAHTMPSEKILLAKKWLYLSIAVTLGVMLLNMSSYAFIDVTVEGLTSKPVAGLGLLPFSFVSTLFSLLAIFLLVHRYLFSVGVVRKQVGLVLLGMVLMLVCIIATILVPIIQYNSIYFLPFTPLYVLLFIGLTAFAIIKYQLFSIKVLLTQALTFIILIVQFAKLFGETSRNAQIVDGLVLLFTFVFGFFLVKSVKREVEQREHIEKLAKDLEVANAHLKELDRQKTEFVSIASHQLRSPLTAIKGYSSLILEGSFGKIPKKAIEAIEKIFSSSKYMAVSIEDFLNVSRIELGTIKYDIKEFDVAKMVEEVVSELQPAVIEKKLTLVFTNECGGGCTIKGDQGKLRQVLLNLVDNAMKYTPKGGISVTTKINSVGKSFRIEIKDTGVGIPAKVLPTLFAKFVRASNANEVNVMGTGLGLYVAKQFVEAHGGKVWAESEGQDKGSTFIVEFPLLNK